jgi:RNA chaperone Hfq
MEKTGSQNIQDAFLNTLRREKAFVTIHLMHGTTLKF